MRNYDGDRFNETYSKIYDCIENSFDTADQECRELDESIRDAILKRRADLAESLHGTAFVGDNGVPLIPLCKWNGAHVGPQNADADFQECNATRVVSEIMRGSVMYDASLSSDFVQGVGNDGSSGLEFG